jgi:hypothetical protein
MGTRSTTGVRVNGQDKLTYNQMDGYPSYMGKVVYQDCIAMIKEHGWDKIKEMAEDLQLTKSDKNFTQAQKRKYGHLWENVSTGKDMYSLLRGLQGELKLTLETGVMIENNNFIKDSLFCEWGYILNVDEKTLEVYEGFQTKKPKGRYKGAKNENGYYPCTLIKTIKLADQYDELYNCLSIDWDNFEEQIEA